MSKSRVAESQEHRLALKQTDRLCVLQEVNQLIASGDNPETVLETILDHLLKTFDYRAAQIYQLSATGSDLALYIERGPGMEPTGQSMNIFSLDEANIVSDALDQNTPIYVPDIRTGSNAYYDQDNNDPGLGSEVAVPLKYSQRHVGVLRVQSNEPHAFEQSDINFIANLANLMASVISSNRTIQQLKDDLQETKIIYNLQHEGDLALQRPGDSSITTAGYQYDKTTVTNVDEPTLAAKLAAAGVQTGVATIQDSDHRDLVAPIQLHGETIGILGLEEEIEGAAWTTDDINLLEEVSSQVALAIENSRLLQQTRARTKDLAILFEATRQLTETIDFNQIYEILTTQVISYLQADRCRVLLLNEAKTQVKVIVEKVRQADNNFLDRSELEFRPVEDFGSLQHLLKQPDVIIEHLDNPDLKPDTRKYMEQEPDREIHTLTQFPLVVRNNLLGLMAVEYFHQRHNFTGNQLQLAQAIISQVTVAIENAQLFQQTQAALSDIQKYYRISRALVESTRVEDIFNVVIENVKTYGVDRVSISLLDRSETGEIESATIVAIWDKDPNKILPVGTKFSANNFSLIHAFAQPPFHPLILEDLRETRGQDERIDQAFRTFALQDLEVISIFSAPMFLGDEYKGVLSIYTRKPHTYGQQEIRVYQTLADQAIIAIENRRLLEATRRERDRASLLYGLGQTLSYTTTVDEVNQAVIDFIQNIGVPYSEIYITDGEEFVALASTIPGRQQLSAHELVTGEAEPLTLSRQETMVKTRDPSSTEAWPLDALPELADIQAWASIPFFSQRSTLQGVLNFFHTSTGGFTADQLTTFDSVAIQTVAALENVWLLRQTNIVLNETELLYRVTRGFNSVQTLDDLLMVIATNLTETGLDAMAIALIPELTADKSPARLEIISHWSKATEAAATISAQLSPDQFSFIRKMHSEKPQEFYYNKLDPDTQRNVDQYLDRARTILSIPLTVGQNWLGLLLMISQADGFVFNVNTINQIFTLGGQAAVVMRNLQLVEETQRNLFNSEILSNLGQQLLAADTTQAIFGLALEAIAATEPDRGVAIFMYDQLERDVDLEVVGVWNNPRQQWPAISTGMRYSTEKLGLTPLLKTGMTLVSRRATEDERFSTTLKQLLAVMQTSVLVAVPLWLQQAVAGFILISNQTETQFGPDIIRLYEDIGREVSGALENQRLFKEIEYRARQLQTAAEVSQAATSYLDLDTLLAQSVDLIRDRFDFYHVSIFLVDEYQRYAVVRASTGEIGQKMLAMNHKLEVGGKSVVGTATGMAKSCIALDVGQDAVHFNNPLVPDTRSEIALPLVAQGRVIGALDVQSTKQGAFSESDITILQSMANQLANAIEAARSFLESKEALEEISRLHEHYLADQWKAYRQEHKSVTGYRLAEEGLVASFEDDDLLPAADLSQVVNEKRPVIIAGKNGHEHLASSPQRNRAAEQADSGPAAETEKSGDVSTLIAPLTLNGQTVIGTVDFELPTEDIGSISDEDTLKIIEAVTVQAAQAIEAARLFNQTQISREEAEALYDVARVLVATEDEQKMFNTVLSRMLSTLGLNQGGILFIDDDRKSGRLYALFEDGQPVSHQNLRFPIAGNPSYQRLIKTRLPVVIEDVATDPLVATVREINLGRGIVSLLLVPIIINDEVIGAIGADSVGQKHIFTEREINLAVAMADQLSLTLQNRRLMVETAKRAGLLQINSDVGRVATSILDQDKMLDEAVNLIKERFGFYHVQIFLVDEVEEYATLFKSTGQAGRKLSDLDHKFAIGSSNIIGQATYQRLPIVARQTDDQGSGIAHHQPEFLPDTQAELAIPLQVGTTLIGVLDVQSNTPDAFSDEEISTLETLGTQLAIAIQNARAFKEQQETAEHLKEIDRLKTQFLANMSHELRTPLNSIIGFSRVILKGIDGPLTELQKADLTSIYNSGQHLLGLINNILDLSKIEAGKMELNFEQVKIEPIVRTVMSTALALVKDKDIVLYQEVPEDLPTIYADATRIRQVVLNLVSNACKFTEQGSVTTRVWADDKKVVFSVNDTGIGIPPDQLDNVFDEFTQVDASTTRKAGGTGLGLPISRHFVEMHQGNIWVESEFGQGSVFSFDIPIEPPDKKEREVHKNLAAKIPDEKDRRCVVAIDSDPGVIALYQKFLKQRNYDVVGLSHDENVMAQIKARAPFAILLDVIGPDQDGWNIIKALKGDRATKDIPVIICTMSSDKNRGFSLGAADYLLKPIIEEELIEALAQVDTPQKENLKVLVVDDQADDILLIRRILEAQPYYSIFEASNGKAGLELVESEDPDLIILDLNMPEMNGFAMVEALKADIKTRSIPIIIVSARQLTQEEQACLTGQVEVLLRKGIFTENELLEDVNQALSRIGRAERIAI